MDFAIETIDLVKDYLVRTGRSLKRRPKCVVDHLNIQVRSGEVYGFLGKNGAGKTTTIKMILGLTFPTAGAVRVLDGDGLLPATRARIGFAPEKPAFHSYLTAGEVMLYAGELLGLRKRIILEKTPGLLELVGLADDQNRPVSGFSKGMQQRLGLAQALIAEPDLIIFDEPATGLDPFGRKFVKNLILHLKEQGKTVFFSSHQLLDVQEVCDRVGIIHGGKLICEDTVANLLSAGDSQAENLEERFVEIVSEIGGREAWMDPKTVD